MSEVGQASGTPGQAGVPRWLRRAGVTSWLLTGVAVAVAMGVLALMVARPVLLPVAVMAGAATIAEPLVTRLARRRVPRVLGAVVVALLVLGLAAFVVTVFVVGVVDQWDSIVQVVAQAVDRARELVAGIPRGTEVVDDASQLGPTLAVGVLSQLTAGVAGLVTAAIGVLLAVYILLLVLADAPRIHALVVRWIPGPPGLGKAITEQAAHTVRRYFVGLTWIALMNAVVIALGALVLRVPFVAGIGVLCFVAAYIPYVGAFLSGAFAVLLALGSGGPGTALAMVGVIILANSVLENLARPLTFGAVLRLHPLVVLLATLAGGVLGGAVGMMIAPPVAAVTADVARQLRRTRERE